MRMSVLRCDFAFVRFPIVSERSILHSSSLFVCTVDPELHPRRDPEVLVDYGDDSGKRFDQFFAGDDPQIPLVRDFVVEDPWLGVDEV